MNLLTSSQIARVCHEANRALQAIQAAPGIPIALPWDEIPADMRASVVSGVCGIIEGNTPEESHEDWCEFRKAQGWVYGPVKDEEKKTHPCLLPYNMLPPDQQMKDHLFSSIVKALA